MSYTEPKKIKNTASLGNLTVTFEGEQFAGLGILDTSVNIAGQNLCAITWKDQFDFINDLNDVISKYRI